MIDVTVRVDVNRPADEVFAIVADMEYEPRWHTDIVQAERRFERYDLPVPLTRRSALGS